MINDKLPGATYPDNNSEQKSLSTNEGNHKSYNIPWEECPRSLSNWWLCIDTQSSCCPQQQNCN